MTTGLLALASVVAVSVVSLVGLLAISLREARARALARLFVSFAVGALLGDAFIHVIPEAFTGDGAETPLRSSLLILGGMMLLPAPRRPVRGRRDQRPR